MCFNRPKAPKAPKPIAVPPTPPAPPPPKPLKPPKPAEKETKPIVQYGSKKKATKPGEKTGGVESLRIPLNVPTASKNGGLNVKG